ncbi:DUF3592 domain-containing protein [uncultured Paraglaciecola sp.]|uniref:DUF3592 domain-containing protein n=1 Tax=uncultured Paraglaciecola sp. TaxID=1765024 RepID=UPI0030DDCB71
MNIIPLIGGLGFGSLGLFILFDYYRFNKDAIKAYGKILRYDEYQSKDNNGRKRTNYRPSFEFSANGKVYEVKSKTSFSSKIIPVGQHTNVLFQAGDESNARLAKGNGYGLGVLFIALSIPAIYFGAFK